MCLNFVLSIVASLLVAIIFYIIEILKKSKITLLTQTDSIIDDDGAPPAAVNGSRIKEKLVRVKVKNKESFLGITRYPARGVHARISFLTETNQKECEREMHGRWASLEKPFIYLPSDTIPQFGQAVTRVGISPELFRNSEYIDIHAGDEEALEIVVKIENEEISYGWCNESFLENHRHKQFRLNKGIHKVVVKVQWDAGVEKSEFILHDGGSLDTFFLDKHNRVVQIKR